MTRSGTRRALAATAVMGVSLALTLGACSKKKEEGAKPSESSTTTSTAAGSGGTTVNQGPTVEITEFRFDPVPVDAKVGQIITWKNDGSAKHTITHDVPDEQRKFKSETLAPGDQFVFTFTEPGTYTYICSVHPERMRGTINVTAS